MCFVHMIVITRTEFLPYLLGIHILQVHELKGIPRRESKSMRRRRIFSLFNCGQCCGILHGSRVAVDFPVSDWLLTSKAKQYILTM